MTADQTPTKPTGSAARGAVRKETTSQRRRAILALQVIQVRLRFVAVLVVAFLVVGLWGNFRNVWDTMWHRFAGSHALEHSVSIDTEYYCPMCPGVVSDWPAICPVCNMDLVRHKKGEAVVLPEGLVARMQFSPYRVQLAGIKTSVVRRQPLAREIILAGRLVDFAAPEPADRRDSGATPPGETGPVFILECEAYAVDLPLLTPGRLAEVTIEGLSGLKPIAGKVLARSPDAARGRSALFVRIRLDEAPAQLSAGMYATARVNVPLREIVPFATPAVPAKPGESPDFVAVPETAVVDMGTRRVVFVETMPGMFDGVEVTLGPRCGDDFPVLAGLEPGQKVATVGAFLIDAEARRSRNVATEYFGAARSAGPEPAAASSASAEFKPDEKRATKKKSTTSKLSASDQQLVKQQKTCPVTGAPLDSMGGPVAVNVEGRRVFICCKACEAPLKKDPRKYLAKLQND
jgi:Cu(I)/Ag(I) efflux system membrane fusion protein